MLLRFHWKSVSLIVFSCFGLQYLLLYFMHQPIPELKEYYDPEEPQILVDEYQNIYHKNIKLFTYFFCRTMVVCLKGKWHIGKHFMVRTLPK